jgi:glutaminyl-peptide cyclotransferase
MMVAALALASCGDADVADVEPLGTDGGAPTRYTVRVVATHPHDEAAFTQGLVWAGDGQLFESTGRRGQSSVRRVDVETGEVLQDHALGAEYFAEGLALVQERLIQLTWQEGTAFVYDATSFEVTTTFTYDGEGWGLCFDGDRLVMSSGNSTLVFRDPETFESEGQVRVTFEGQALDDLNELECIGDRVYANVLGDDRIYEIDPSTGAVTAVVDASALDPEHDEARGEVLNGIAYDPSTGHYYLTGKNWPSLYEVTFERQG